MNGITNPIPLHAISVPELNSAEFATGLQNAFININKNFALLANKDFVKGESGESVKIQQDSFFDSDGNITILGLKLKTCIESNCTEAELDDIKYVDTNQDEIENEKTISVWDNFTPDNAGYVHMIYNQINDNVSSEPISSLYYVFLDARFANSNMGAITRYDKNAAIYSNLKDASCILVYDKDVKVTLNIDGEDEIYDGGFKILSNAFPTIYYEPGVGLCWKINSSYTGIPVQGLPGRDGYDAVTRIVKCVNVEKSNTGIIFGEVSQIHNNFNGYEDVTGDITKYNNNAALVLVIEDVNKCDSCNSVNTGFYFGQLKINDDGKLYAYCNQQNAINYGLSLQTVIDAMKHIDINNNGDDVSEGIKGIYIPIKDVDENGVQPIHLLTATSITNNVGDNIDDRTDVVFTPIDNINENFNSEDILVDKYLYLRINKNSDIFNDINISRINDTNFKGGNLAQYDYVVKYKLTNVVTNIDSDFFNAQTEQNPAGSRFYGAIVAQYKGSSTGVTTLAMLSEFEDNIKYYKIGSEIDNYPLSYAEYTTNHFDSMPHDFKKRLYTGNEQPGEVKPGIYRWELCRDYDSFDVDELKSQQNIANDKYAFPNSFNVIFTDSITPGSTTKYMWFNGIQKVDNYQYFNLNEKNAGTINDNARYTIPGWYPYKNKWDNLFSFVKFVPVYNNTHEYIGDTALNLNYNVNITGSQSSTECGLNVNGKVNCNEINADTLFADEIKNVFTNDVIVGTNGLKLASQDDDTYAVNVSADGKISTINSIDAKSIILKDSASANTITADNINADNLNICDNVIVNSQDDSFNIDVKNFNNISIERENDKYSTVTNNSPVINYGNSNIIVTNMATNSDSLCYYGVKNYTVSKSGNDEKITKNDKDIINDPCFNNVLMYTVNDIKSNKSGTASQEHNNGNGIILNSDVFKTRQYVTDFLSNTEANNNLLVQLKILSAFPNSKHRVDNLEASMNIYDVKYPTMLSGGTINMINTNTALCSFDINVRDKNTIGDKTDYTYLSSDNDIKITFGSNYVARICCKGNCSYSDRPVLWGDDSEMTLHVIVDVEGDIYELKELQQYYKFDYVENTIKSSAPNHWVGYDSITGKELSGREELERYYDFVFKPNNITISKGSPAFNQLYKSFAERNVDHLNIKIYVIPSYKLRFRGQDNTNVIRSAHAYLPLPIQSYNGNIVANMLNVVKIDNAGIGLLNTKTVAQNPAIIDYYTIHKSENNNNYKVTTLCDDGIIIRKGNTVFGIGTIDDDISICSYTKPVENDKDEIIKINAITALNTLKELIDNPSILEPNESLPNESLPNESEPVE